jgi:nitrile hydratase
VTEPFVPCDVVRVASVNPPRHRHTPFYIRGKQGVIERACGDFANPEELG